MERWLWQQLTLSPLQSFVRVCVCDKRCANLYFIPPLLEGTTPEGEKEERSRQQTHEKSLTLCDSLAYLASVVEALMCIDILVVKSNQTFLVHIYFAVLCYHIMQTVNLLKTQRDCLWFIYMPTINQCWMNCNSHRVNPYSSLNSKELRPAGEFPKKMQSSSVIIK